MDDRHSIDHGRIIPALERAILGAYIAIVVLLVCVVIMAANWPESP